ncbi:ribonuclease HI family protein [Candidatus Nomurabacteria bacterium]|uniref:Ribonuclease HI family protein n=1 Tax=candidate division WWE3 bacterium TaxID=2053526 RepID=A0A955E1B8_UNCKA|nr:ribonuclease HI family protein [candidate division WWE3 bacterium]MCB9823519.1 ribonuclease HI family protein [Candidatus Nomurabacteria bacterium]MCB9827314.1 ribonuclease HI family protein [Candidatus Nomurabacteria bacterium]HXK52406.1 ribonuclease HI family protein [bacterium]
MQVFLNTDGGARGNPGHGAAGIVIFENDAVKHTRKKYLGICTNNEAEYLALILGLEEAIKHGYKNIVCRLDSELVVKQLTGVYKVKTPHIKILHDKAATLVKKFSTVIFTHVPRSQNSGADSLVNEAIDEYLSSEVRKSY